MAMKGQKSRKFADLDIAIYYITGPPLEIQIEGCKASNLSKNAGNFKEILKIEGCN